MVTKALTEAQRRAYEKLTAKPQSAYILQESMATLNALVSKGCARKISGLGSMFDPRTNVEYYRPDLRNA